MDDLLAQALDEMQHEADENQYDENFLNSRDETSKYLNRQDRLANCRKIFRTTFDGQSGRENHSMFVCGLPECPFCNTMRASKLETAVNKAIIEGASVWMIRTNDPMIINKAKAGGKDAYKALPQADGSEVIFYNASMPIWGSERITENDIAATPWADYTVTPPGKRTSGALGKASPTEHAENTQKIQRAVLIAETEEKETLLECTREAIAETKDLNPKTAEQVQEAISQRVSLLASKLRSKNIICKIIYRKYNLDLSCIDWSSIRNNWQVNRESERIEYSTQLSFTSN